MLSPMRRLHRTLPLAMAAAGLACTSIETETRELPPRPSGTYAEAPRATMPSSNRTTLTLPEYRGEPEGS